MESPLSLWRTHWDHEPETCSLRSADFQSAVSRISNPPTPGCSDELPAGSRRYSRLETCATDPRFMESGARTTALAHSTRLGGSEHGGVNLLSQSYSSCSTPGLTLIHVYLSSPDEFPILQEIFDDMSAGGIQLLMACFRSWYGSTRHLRTKGGPAGEPSSHRSRHHFH